MPDFPKCLLIVTAEIDPAEEEAWNTWYDEVHLPDALACPGVNAGVRYVSVGDTWVTEVGVGSASPARCYTTIYELDGPEALETPEFKAMRGWDRFAGKIASTTRVFQRC
ncbi:MAG: hypothetical protein QF578_24250 [Alphaproteobacteria bacterium]|jgi:hypothetical protein|nr:hypothetical protein [Alphaproteobacteria bacterium]MDP6567959.1 hypothetical protein [Alphaproteobacteria bacterium]MDP6812369.1 hypothetical protein [Alphaproteobacteria bacterium]